MNNYDMHFMCKNNKKYLGPAVQSIVSFTSLFVVKVLTVLVITISNSQLFLLKKMRVAFANAKATHIFFSKNSVYDIFNDRSDMLIYDILSFEQLPPDVRLLNINSSS